MATDADLFATAPGASVLLDRLSGEVPILTVDGIFEDPHAVRETALALNFGPGTGSYPGRIARYRDGDPSLASFLRKVVAMVERDYLPILPPLRDGRKITRVRGLDTDFAITELHPDELNSEQRKPHIDPVMIFGLVYLNEEQRGGTMFYKTVSRTAPADPGKGYPKASFPGLELAGRIEGRFNRLAVYPGTILHTGEIEGDWIAGDERFRSPRLTQRIMFFF